MAMSSSSPPSGSRDPPAAKPSKQKWRADMLRRRVLPLATFAQEVKAGKGKPSPAACQRLYGSTVVPIPVPLAVGESEAQYEAKFIAWTKTRGIKTEDFEKCEHPNRERTVRYTYAVDLAKAYNAKSPRERMLVEKDSELEEGEEVEDGEDRVQENDEADKEILPRDVLLAKVIVTLDHYREDVKSGRFSKLAFMSSAEKKRLFGSAIVPISVPLAPGETPQQYEQRFIGWLKREKGMTLEDAINHRVRTLERYLRLQFASLNGTGAEKFVPPASKKRPLKSVDGSVESKKAKQGESSKKDLGEPEKLLVSASPGDDCVGGGSVRECTLCQCRRCLIRGMQLLADRVTLREQSHSGTTEGAMMDLTQGADESTDDEGSVRTENESKKLVVDDGSVSRELYRVYDEVNEVIVTNEKVLEIEANQLACVALSTNVRDVTRIQQENDELRELIDHEYERRRVAVAMVVAYNLRYKKTELLRMVQDPSASNVDHVQSSIHRCCANISSEIAKLEPLEPEDNVNQTIEQLKYQRWNQFVTLVHFDEVVRNTIEGLIAQAEV